VGGYEINYDSGIVDVIYPDGSFAAAEITTGDKLISIDGNVGIYQPYWLESKIPVNVVIERDKIMLTKIVTFKSFWDEDELFHILYHALIFLVVFAGIFVLIKKPDDTTAKVFYFFCVIFANTLHTRFFMWSYFLVPSSFMTLSYPLFPPLFFHFLTIFPYRHEMDRRFNWMRVAIYAGGIFFGLLISAFYLNFMLNRTDENNILRDSVRIAANYWMGISILFAIVYGFIKYIRIKESYSKNQLRWIMIGFFFGMLLPMIFGISQSVMEGFIIEIPNLLLYINGVGTPIMLTCFLFAIMKYKVWDIEIIIKIGLLYSAITFTIIGIYFLIIYFVESFLNESSGTAKVIGISAAALAFIPVREGIQKRVNKIFYREELNPANAIFHFENNLLGIYEKEKLYPAILSEINKIFHFESCTIFLLKKENIFEEVRSIGRKSNDNLNEIKVADEFIKVMLDGRSLAINELKNKIDLPGSEIITPLIDEQNIIGFLACGRKKSQEMFTLQDINFLQLLAQRIISLIKISDLYKKELERQLMVERERERISRDMHDEIGSSLTRISIISELVKKKFEDSPDVNEQLDEIAKSSRGIISNISEIIWAINPNNDSLDDLISYLNHYASKYLEGTGINYEFCGPETLPELKLTSEQRRNIFLTVKEALNNAVKYSEAELIILEVSINEKSVFISVKDNGKGFVGEDKKFGNGLNNMRKRIVGISGLFSINTSQGNGTIIQIRFDK